MLLSRVADSLYWISRYLERAEHTARVMDVIVDLGLGRAAPLENGAIELLYGGLGLAAPIAPGGLSTLADAAFFDTADRNSVLACVTAARENARQVREEISSDMWEQLNALYLRMRQMRGDGEWSGRTHYVARSIVEGVHLFQGISDATMGHGEGWQYLQAGRFLERAGSTATLLDLFLSAHGGRLTVFDAGDWVGLLRSCSALEAYCRQYTADVRPERVAEFLLLSAEFPRSVRFAAASLESALLALAKASGRGAGGRADRLAGRLHASLDYGQLDEILSDGAHVYLAGIGRQCALIHGALTQTYITYAIESALPA